MPFPAGGRKNPDRLLTTREAAHLLNVSCRTLQRMRSEQRIAYVVLRGKCRYRQSEIDRLLEDSTITGDAATPEQMKRNHTLRTGGTTQRKEDVGHGTAYPQQFRELDAESDGTARPSGRVLLSMQPSGKAPNPMDGIRLFDNQDLCMLLQISKRTLQRYRSIGALPYKTLGKKTYYSEADVLTFLSEHVKDFRKEDIAFYKARIHNFFQK